jgi:hypothetical protein
MVRVKKADGQQVIVITLGAGTKAVSTAETEALIKYSDTAKA